MFSWLRGRRAGWVAAVLAVMATATATAAVTAEAAGDDSAGRSDTTASIAALGSRLDTITARGVLTVCSTGDYRPFSFRDASGNWSGVDIDMAGDLAKRLGVKLAFHQSTFATIAKDVGRRCDIGMGGISITLDRARSALFTQPYLRDGKTPITLCANTSKYQTLAQIDQPGVRVIVNPGGTNEQFDTANLHRATIVHYADNNTIFDALLAGQADLMITDATETRYQAKLHPGQLCAVHPDAPFTFAEKAYVTPRGDLEWQQWVDQWLHIALNDGTFQGISGSSLG
jgi:cyclohexadienyl dehydratase